MKKGTYMFFLMLTILSLTACVTTNPAPIVRGGPHTRSVGAAQDAVVYTVGENRPIQVPVLRSIPSAIRGIYEPTDSIYLGAWLAPDMSIRDFNDKVGQRHAVFVHEMHIDDEVPANWVLQCIAALATPLIMLHPAANDAEDAMLARLAQNLGAFDLPMFVAFYPHGTGAVPAHGLTPAEYSIAFRYARAVFLRYAPHVAFVWVAPSLQSTIRNPFFPGSDVVDWVGVPLLSYRNSDGFAADIIADFAQFYQTFQAHHPIMALPLGVSHFSRADHVYQLEAASAEITRIYRELMGFPRLGLVIYADAFGIGRGMQDDFSITLEDQLIKAYSAAISTRHFAIQLEQNARQGPRWVRSASTGYLWEGQIFINTNTLDELSITVPRNITEIGDHSFVDADRITRSISFCNMRHAVLIE